MIQFKRPAFGMGACCDSCAHGGKCSGGMGLFETGLDLTGWGWPEFAIAAFAVYASWSALVTTKRGVRAVGEGVRKTRRKIGGAVAGKGRSKKSKGWGD